jgi:hypothetical protein
VVFTLKGVFNLLHQKKKKTPDIAMPARLLFLSPDRFAVSLH